VQVDVEPASQVSPIHDDSIQATDARQEISQILYRDGAARQSAGPVS
jgi:hypothetical protein